MDQWNRIEDPEINQHTLDLWQRNQNHTVEKKKASSKYGAVLTDGWHVEEWKFTIFITLCNAQVQVGQEPQGKTRHPEFSRRESETKPKIH